MGDFSRVTNKHSKKVTAVKFRLKKKTSHRLIFLNNFF